MNGKKHALIAGPIELTLVYGKPGELGRTTEPQTVKALVQRMHTFVSVGIPEIGTALLKPPGLTWARIKLTDGTLIEGTVRSVNGNYFELVEGHQ